MTKKLIALDLDGTLLRSDNTISDYTIDTLKKVREQGHQVLIATGRPYRMALPFYKQLGLDTPMISFNGSLTHLPEQKWKFEHSRTIEKKFLIDVLNMKHNLEADFIASEYRNKFFITTDFKEKINPELFGVPQITDKMAMDMNKITENPNALLMQTRHHDRFALADDIKKHFKHELEVDSWGGPLNILEFSPKDINKAYALNYLLDAFQKSPEDLIAFGDEHNDTEMLALAGTGYAMKNASDRLLPYADRITHFDNNQDGVAKELEKLLL